MSRACIFFFFFAGAQTCLQPRRPGLILSGRWQSRWVAVWGVWVPSFALSRSLAGRGGEHAHKNLGCHAAHIYAAGNYSPHTTILENQGISNYGATPPSCISCVTIIAPLYERLLDHLLSVSPPTQQHHVHQPDSPTARAPRPGEKEPREDRLVGRLVVHGRRPRPGHPAQ
jgi:hypothetical protein